MFVLRQREVEVVCVKWQGELCHGVISYHVEHISPQLQGKRRGHTVDGVAERLIALHVLETLN